MKIIFTGGSRDGEQVDLNEKLKSTGSVMLGRSHACDVRLEEPDISGKHLDYFDTFANMLLDTPVVSARSVRRAAARWRSSRPAP